MKSFIAERFTLQRYKDRPYKYLKPLGWNTPQNAMCIGNVKLIRFLESGQRLIDTIVPASSYEMSKITYHSKGFPPEKCLPARSPLQTNSQRRPVLHCTHPQVGSPGS